MRSENVFDSYAATAFETVADVMGYLATWKPQASKAAYQGRVLFRNPSQTARFLDQEYITDTSSIEFRAEQFPGLTERVRAHKTENVELLGKTFQVFGVQRIADGGISLALLVETKNK